MKLFGSLTEIISLVFRKNSQTITVRPNQATTYTAARDVQLPPGDTAHVFVSETATQTLTNKTLTSPAVNSPTGITKSDVGLSNVDNTSDATKNAATATLTNKTLTSPVINSPTGIVKADVGLGNVDNTSDATKDAAVATLTNKTLTSPVINTPTGIVKGDVGLGNVDNTSDATKNAASVTLTNKTISGSNNTLTVLAATQLSGATPIANGGTGQTGATAAFNALDPTTTKGDIIVNNGTDAVRLPVGTNAYALIADSAQTTGVKWAPVTASGPYAGDTSGSAVAAGNIGEIISSGTMSETVSTNGAPTFTDITGASITLTPGVWIIKAQGNIGLSTNTAGTAIVQLFTSANVYAGGNIRYKGSQSTALDSFCSLSMDVYKVVTTTTTYKLRITGAGTNAYWRTNNDQTVTHDTDSYFYAVRVA